MEALSRGDKNHRNMNTQIGALTIGLIPKLYSATYTCSDPSTETNQYEDWNLKCMLN
jgi:hypothetical protein